MEMSVWTKLRSGSFFFKYKKKLSVILSGYCNCERLKYKKGHKRLANPIYINIRMQT